MPSRDMGWRRTAALALAVLTACGRGDDAKPPPAPNHVEVARQALATTRNAATAVFATEATVVLDGGTLTTRRQGSYDLGTGTAAATQTVEADPPALLDRLRRERRVAVDAELRTVVTGLAVYVQAAAWPRAIRAKWLRFEAARLGPENRRYGFELSPDVLPAMLEMLDKAAPNAGGGPDAVTVLVPAKDAFLALPSGMAGAAVAAGADPEELTGTVTVTVEVARGVVTRVTYDATEPVRQAMRQLGRDDAPTEVRATLDVTGHGRGVSVEAPSPREVMTTREYEAAS